MYDINSYSQMVIFFCYIGFFNLTYQTWRLLQHMTISMDGLWWILSEDTVFLMEMAENSKQAFLGIHRTWIPE